MNESQEELAKKQQISRILDIDIQTPNETFAAVRCLNGAVVDVPAEMTKEQYYELTKKSCRKRNLSIESEGSSESEKPFGNKDIIVIDVSAEDTLQKLALKYNCHVQELKVANKIYNDIDLHALKIAKIPVVKDGQIYDEYHKAKLSESVNIKETYTTPELDSKYKFKVHTKHEIRQDLDFLSSSDDEDLIYDFKESRFHEEEHLLADRRSVFRDHSNQPVDGHDEPFPEFIERKDKELEKKIAETESQNEKFDSLKNAMPAQVVFPAGPISKPEQYGSVCSFTWCNLLCAFCVIAVVLPVLYFIHYFSKKS